MQAVWIMLKETTPAKAEGASTRLEQMCICSLKAIDSSITVPKLDGKR